MRATIVFASLSALALQGVVAQSSDVNPAVQYLTQTDANGVVTGQPVAVTSQAAAVTSQQAAVTSQEPAASIPAGLTAPVVTPQRSLTSVARSSGSASDSDSATVTSTGKSTATSTGTSTDSSTDSSSDSSSSSKSGSPSSSGHATSTGGAAIVTAAPFVMAGAALVAFL